MQIGELPLIFSVMTYRHFCMILAEFIGTFLLLLFGCMGAVEVSGVPEGLIKSFNWGMAVLMVIQMIGHISFAIINPAVTLAAVINGLISVQVSV